MLTAILLSAMLLLTNATSLDGVWHDDENDTSLIINGNKYTYIWGQQKKNYKKWILDRHDNGEIKINRICGSNDEAKFLCFGDSEKTKNRWYLTQPSESELKLGKQNEKT